MYYVGPYDLLKHAQAKTANGNAALAKTVNVLNQESLNGVIMHH